MNYDFNNVNDLKSLISVLLDGYVPYQFEQFSAEIIEEAIKSLKQDEIELTGNIISGEAVKLGMFYADNRLDDLLNDDVMELTAAEQETIDTLIRKYPYGVFNTIIECFCNGSLDTSVYLNCEDEDYAALNIIKEKSDIFDYLENNIGLEF